ncbi:alpha/beta hydrolase [Longibacter salinarum]|uniref:Alpha/beta hydrolase n=1 Tax=Longibacter salinarum TaxID=1850348 RepID=A0A2A8CX31_9BACT|nr:alpha/beta hydrolase [Longibacter salinarum]PEN13309.1 alpha/beta hydrolase [Longibacter salinarum]
MPTARVNGTTLAYEVSGDGEPVVLVHGSASDHRTWSAQKDAFAEQFRVISYSRRYHWPNEPIPEDAVYIMDEHVDDLRALIRSLDLAPAHLVGNSYGAFLCLLLAIRDPSLVRSLVLAEPPVLTLFVSNDPTALELLKVLLTRPRTAVGILRLGIQGIDPAKRAFEQGDQKAGLRTFVDAVLGPRAYDRLPDFRREQVEDNVESLQAELLGPGFSPLDAEKVQQIQAPTLLVTGEDSIGLFHRLTDRLEELLPRCERTEILEAPHTMHEANAPAFNAAVRSFLETHHQTGGQLPAAHAV